MDNITKNLSYFELPNITFFFKKKYCCVQWSYYEDLYYYNIKIELKRTMPYNTSWFIKLNQVNFIIMKVKKKQFQSLKYIIKSIGS
jgi:hypothetical protein